MNITKSGCQEYSFISILATLSYPLSKRVTVYFAYLLVPKLNFHDFISKFLGNSCREYLLSVDQLNQLNGGHIIFKSISMQTIKEPLRIRGFAEGEL